MFEEIGKNRVRSSWGFEVSVRTNATQIYAAYREGDHSVQFDNTRNTTNLGYPAFSFRPEHIKHWAPPFEEESLVSGKRKRIIEDMAAALDFMGISSNALDEDASVIGAFGPNGWSWKDEKWLSQ
jgi:hypothetical protein